MKIASTAEIDQTELRARVAQVAAKCLAYRYYHWDWGESIAMEGLWLAQRVTGEKRFGDFVFQMIESWMQYRPDPWCPDHVGPGRMLVQLWEDSRQRRFLDYAGMLAEHLAGLPRASCGGHFHRYDLPDRAKLIWVDSIQTDAPFLASLARATGEDRWFDLAGEFIVGHIAALQDPASGLFHHNYDDQTGRRNGVFWGRGNGWAMLGLVDTLELMPREHRHYETIHLALIKLAEAANRWQNSDSTLWHTVINESKSYREGSVSLMFVAGLMRAGRLGLIPSKLTECASSVWRALWRQVNEEGIVARVSARTPARSSAVEYEIPAVGGNYPWGQGAYLLAAARYLGM